MEARALQPAPPRKSSPKTTRENAVASDQAEKVVGLARKSFDMVRNREPDSELVSSTLSSYREALEALAKLLSKETWKLEREILPDELKNVTMGAFGLPKTVVPLSLSNSLINRELDRLIEGLEFRSDELATVSKILDRYVRVDFPLDDISEFYRPAVEQLRERQGRLTPESYLSEVIHLARELTEKHHNLKIDLHKNICTQTGGMLAQSDSDNTPRPKKRIQAMKKQAEASGSSIDASLRLRWGAPVTDSLPTGKRHSPPKKAELETQLRPVAPEGQRGWLLAHPDLPGMLFTSEQCAEAFSLVVNADFFTIRPNSKVKMPEEQAAMIEALRQLREFRMASHMKDRKGQLKIVLELLQLELHAAEILDRNIAMELSDAWQVAREDFAKAYQWMAEFEKEKDSKPSSLTSTPVRRMIHIWSASRHVAPFDIALAVALEMRGDRKSLVTERPSFDNIPPEEIEAARPSLKSPKPPALPEEWMDPELESSLPTEEGEFSEAVRKHARRLRYLVAMGAPDEAEELYREAVEKLVITYSVDSLVRLATEIAEAELEDSETTTPGALSPLASTDEETAPPASAKEEPAPDSERRSKRKTLMLPLPPPPAVTVQDGSPESAEAEATETPAEALPPIPSPAKTVELPEEVTQPAVNPAKMMLGRLNQNDLELVMAILGRQGACDEAELNEFRFMDAGVRDLRFRNALSAVWTEDDWRGQPEIGEPSKAEHMRSCMNRLYSVCGLAPAALDQMKAAVMDPANLTIGQLAMVSRFFGVNAGNLTPTNIQDFGIWLTGDPEQLKQYWAGNYPETMQVVRLAQKMATYEASGARKRNFTRDEYATLGIIFNKQPDKIDINDVRNIPAVTGYAKQLQAYHERWFGPSPDQRQLFWRTGSANIISVSDLVHRALFADGFASSPDDARVVNAVYGQRDDIPAAALSLASALHNKAEKKMYLPEVLSVHENVFMGSDPVAKLLELVRAKDELNTLGDFLGVKSVRPYGRLHKTDSECRCKFEVKKVQDASGQKHEMTCVGVYDSAAGTITLPNGEVVQAASVANRMKVIREETVQLNGGGTKLVSYAGIYNQTNDDAIAQAVVQLPDGRELELDAVFDGMGGHSTGYVASGIHKNIFEICALSGMIQHPEDVRRVIVMADIAITMESINRKKKDGGGNYVHGRDMQENNMGTTAAISFLCGNELFVIHCGDSPIELFDESGKLVAATIDHAIVVEYLANGYPLEDAAAPGGISNKPNLIAAAVKKFGTSVTFADNSKPFTLLATDFIAAETNGMATSFSIIRNGQVVCQGTGLAMLHEKLVEALDIPYGNVVTGAVGNSIRKTAVNNAQGGAAYQAWIVKDGMLLSLTSDGIRVPLCAHEIPNTVRQCGDDLQKSAQEIVDMAEERTPNGQSSFTPGCGCNDRGSKNDDKSSILKLIGQKKK